MKADQENGTGITTNVASERSSTVLQDLRPFVRTQCQLRDDIRLHLHTVCRATWRCLELVLLSSSFFSRPHRIGSRVFPRAEEEIGSVHCLHQGQLIGRWEPEKGATTGLWRVYTSGIDGERCEDSPYKLTGWVALRQPVLLSERNTS